MPRNRVPRRNDQVRAILRVEEGILLIAEGKEQSKEQRVNYGASQG
jgi:hypothetical protein